MIYLVAYKRKNRMLQDNHKSLIFIEAQGSLVLEKVVALLKNLTQNELEESSVEVIGQKIWDAAKINTPGIRFHKIN